MADVFRLTSFNSSFSILATCNSLHRVLLSADKKAAAAAAAACAVVYPAAGGGGSRLPPIPRRLLPSFKVHATVAETEQPKWWEKNAGPNMIDIHSTQEFLSALSQAGDRLVIVEFYGTWCASCRALFPKLCRTAVEHPEILFLKVNFDENKPMCKSLNVKVLPYFHFYRGAHGQLESFSCSLAKFQKIKDAIEKHSNIGSNSSPTPTVAGGELTLESISTPTEQQTGSSKT